MVTLAITRLCSRLRFFFASLMGLFVAATGDSFQIIGQATNVAAMEKCGTCAGNKSFCVNEKQKNVMHMVVMHDQ